MSAPPILPEDDDALAGELALRVLSPTEEAEARARETAEPAFAAAVDRWNADIAALADEIVPVAPSAAVWPRVTAAAYGAAPLNKPANDNGRLAFWRTWAIGASALLAASVAGLIVLVGRPAPAPVVEASPSVVEQVPSITRVATIQLESGEAALTLAYDPATGNLYVAPSASMGDGARVPHLWLMKPDGGVQLVGALGSEAEMRHLDAALMPMAGEAVAVAVSMEAPGHTPADDKPDGPVVGSGQFQRL